MVFARINLVGAVLVASALVACGHSQSASDARTVEASTIKPIKLETAALPKTVVVRMALDAEGNPTGSPEMRLVDARPPADAASAAAAFGAGSETQADAAAFGITEASGATAFHGRSRTVVRSRSVYLTNSYWNSYYRPTFSWGGGYYRYPSYANYNYGNYGYYCYGGYSQPQFLQSYNYCGASYLGCGNVGVQSYAPNYNQNQNYNQNVNNNININNNNNANLGGQGYNQGLGWNQGGGYYP